MVLLELVVDVRLLRVLHLMITTIGRAVLIVIFVVFHLMDDGLLIYLSPAN